MGEDESKNKSETIKRRAWENNETKIYVKKRPLIDYIESPEEETEENPQPKMRRS